MSEELGTELLSQLNPEDQQEVQHDTVDSCRHKPNFQMSVYFAPNTFDLLIGKSLCFLEIAVSLLWSNWYV